MAKRKLSAKKGHQLGTPGHSLALRYETSLQEEGGADAGAPSISRIKRCFEVLDELLPHLGVYRHVLQLVRDELHMSMYSQDWTSDGSKSAPKKVTPLPYFVVAQRLVDQRAEGRAKLKAELSSVREELYICEADLEKALSEQEEFRRELKVREDKLQKLTSNLHRLYDEREHLNLLISRSKQSQEDIGLEHNLQMLSLSKTNDRLQKENRQLGVFKQTHDNLLGTELLMQTEVSTTTPAVEARANTSMPAVEARANTSMPAVEVLQVEVEHNSASDKLHYQLCTLRNLLMDEYDEWVWCCSSDRGRHFTLEDMECKKKAFVKQIAAISTELSLVDSHRQSLRGKLEQLRQGEGQADKALVFPLHPSNPLIPQEIVTSKYAAMVYSSSDGGNNFNPIKEAAFCYSCAHRTVLCPHKVCQELVLQLPLNTSHLKITRPLMKLVAMTTTCTTSGLQGDGEIEEHVTGGQEALHVQIPNFGYLWSQLEGHFPRFNMVVPRRLSQEQLRAQVEQFYVSVLVQDGTLARTCRKNRTERMDGDENDLVSFTEAWFTFMHRHYLVRSLTPLACHSFLAALEEHCRQDKELLILCHALCGNLTGSAVRYMLVQAALVQKAECTSDSQLSTFFTILYPFLEVDELKKLCGSCEAHSNYLSASTILSFLQDLLLQHNDPLVLMLEHKLADHPRQSTGSMLEIEFVEAMEIILGCISLPCRQLFLESLLHMHGNSRSIGSTAQGSLPLGQLAYTAAYLHRASHERQVQSELKKEQKRREKAENGGNEQSPGAESVSAVPPHNMDTIRLLASSSRRT